MAHNLLKIKYVLGLLALKLQYQIMPIK